VSIDFEKASSESIYWATHPIAVGQDLTFGCWFNVDDITSRHSLMSVGRARDAGGTRHTSLNATGDIGGDPVSMQQRTGSSTSANTTAAYTANTWHHACGTFDRSTGGLAVFIDGGSKGTATGAATDMLINEFRICDSHKVNAFCDGMVAEAGVWDVILTDDEVAMLAAGYPPLMVRPTNLQIYLPMVRDSDHDEMGGVGTGTETGTPTVAVHPRISRPSRGRLFPEVVAGGPATTTIYHHFHNLGVY
jgi:hypothetical protein